MIASASPSTFSGQTQFRMKSGLIVLPTGMGKTFTFTQIAREWTQRTGKSALVLAHRTELIGQAKRTFERLGETDIGIEMANLTLRRHRRMPRIVIASVQTLKSKSRLESFDPMAFSLIVCDEAHHCPADSYRRILQHFDQNPGIAHIGVTATPDRADETALGCVYGQVLYKIEILDAIRDGWLVPVEQQIVQVDDLDFSKVRVRTGDLAANEVESIMKREGALHGVADATIKLAGDRKTIVFAAGVEHGKMLRDIFLRHRADSAVWIDGETPAELRALYIEDFAANRFQILVNCDVCTEGFDDPSIECVVNAAPTKSRAKYTQRVGRGLRTEEKLLDSMHAATAEERRAAIAASSKPSCLVLDFAGDSGRHKLVTTADMLGGNMPDEVIALAEEIVKASGAERDMAEVLALAGEEHERLKAALRADQERAAKEAERLRGMTGEATFRTYEVDPFNKGESFRLKVRGDGPSKNLASQLLSLGVKPKRVEQMDAGEAGKLYRFWADQRAAGRCTYKQAGVLQRDGWSLADAAKLTKAQATEHVSKILGQRSGT